jgi:signal transduction histidine kinase
MVVGHLLAGEPALALAIRQHQPFRAAPCLIEGADAVAGNGRWMACRASIRPAGALWAIWAACAARAQRGRPQTSGEGDRLRQVLHELRTPVNAIQGFAEIIQQQLFGPTPHEYRALAAAIAADGAHAGRVRGAGALARLDSGAMELASGQCDLAECVTALARLALRRRRAA